MPTAAFVFCLDKWKSVPKFAISISQLELPTKTELRTIQTIKFSYIVVVVFWIVITIVSRPLQHMFVD